MTDTPARRAAADQQTPFVGYVGFVSRAVALVIDAFCINVAAAVVTISVNAVVSLVGAGGSVSVPEALAGGFAWAFVWPGIYFCVFWTLTGQTPGARVMAFRVVTAERFEQLSFTRAIHRVGWFFICAVPLWIGFLPVLVDDERRGLHDRRAGTVVRWAPRDWRTRVPSADSVLDEAEVRDLDIRREIAEG